MSFTILSLIYKARHTKTSSGKIPYWYKRSIWQQVRHTLRKIICQVWAPNCAVTNLRIRLYRLCGFKIGRNSFIGMKCYLDDLCYDQMVIGDNVTISYGVYFACHVRNQGHNRIVIKDGAYIGMRASVITPKGDVVIGEKSIIGAMTLVNKSVPDGKTAVGIPCQIL